MKVRSRDRRSFWLVPSQGEAGLAEDMLVDQGYECGREPFFDAARVLTREPKPLGNSLPARFGLIYIQDRSSMLPPLLLNPPPGSRVLDMCASPGGKTGLLARLVGRTGFVLANEPNKARLSVLRGNLLSMNLVQVHTCSCPGEDLPLKENAWPYILLDPPCSGWGTAEKHPKVVRLWRGEKTGPLIALQKKLLARAARLLKPGGRLMYSTCTTNPAENEDQACFALDTLGLELTALPRSPGFHFLEPVQPGLKGCLRVQGGPGEGQGFFLACFTKPRGTASDEERTGQVPDRSLPGRELSREERASCDTVGLENLPAGGLYCFRDRVFFGHEKVRTVSLGGLPWQGFPLGRVGAGKFRPHPRVRVLLPPYVPGRGVRIEALEPLLGLVSGQSLKPEGLEGDTGFAGLYYKDLPLCWLRIKAGRALWSDR
ncbi:MAG: RsmB/NOP family class I SAM-dependent RNA methyltransferase [Thermodesulfobacteriota bacterium]|nr:RsmB/NOP family class I SAM-dependent RNA methyltransferase [Thermodesulfobacteriota bacterium]